jgi:RNA polymerase sigma-70 factor (ECF subfamily)
MSAPARLHAIFDPVDPTDPGIRGAVPPPTTPIPPPLPARPPLRSEARLRALFDTHFDFVWRSLRRLGVPESSARDAAQQVWIVVGRKVDEIEPGAERSFLFGTAMRVASETRRTLMRRRESPDDVTELELPSDAQHPDELLDRKRARETLARVLDAMPEELRTVFVLFELEEMSTAEVATTLGLATGTAASRLRRAREEFAGIVKRMKAKNAFEGGLR